MDYDTYLARMLERREQEDEANELVSDCCGEPIYDESEDVCSECKEHSLVVRRGDRDTDRYEAAMADKADAERELRREED